MKNEYNYGDRAAWYAGLPTWNNPKPPPAVFLDVNRCLLMAKEEAEQEAREMEEFEKSLDPNGLHEILGEAGNYRKE